MVSINIQISKLKNCSFLKNKSTFDIEMNLPNKKNFYKKV